MVNPPTSYPSPPPTTGDRLPQPSISSNDVTESSDRKELRRPELAALPTESLEPNLGGARAYGVRTQEPG